MMLFLKAKNLVLESSSGALRLYQFPRGELEKRCKMSTSNLTVQQIICYSWHVRRKIEEYAERVERSPCLGGLCAYASGEIFKKFSSLGASVSIIDVDDGFHVIAIVNGYLVDVTATQFGGDKKVLVRKLPCAERDITWNELSTLLPVSEYSRSRKCELKRFYSLSEYLDMQKRDDCWLSDQLVEV